MKLPSLIVKNGEKISILQRKKFIALTLEVDLHWMSEKDF